VSKCNFDILPFGKMRKLLPQVLKLLISLEWISYRHGVVIPISNGTALPFPGLKGVFVTHFLSISIMNLYGQFYIRC